MKYIFSVLLFVLASVSVQAQKISALPTITPTKGASYKVLAGDGANNAAKISLDALIDTASVGIYPQMVSGLVETGNSTIFRRKLVRETNGRVSYIDAVGVRITVDSIRIGFIDSRYSSPKPDINWVSSAGANPTPFLTRSNDYLTGFGNNNFSSLKRSYHGTVFGNINGSVADSVWTTNAFGTQNFARANYIVGGNAFGTDVFAGGLGTSNYCNGMGFHVFSNFFGNGSFNYINAIGADIGYNAQTVSNFVGMGYRCGYSLVNSLRTVMIGDNAGYYAKTSNNCTYVGHEASGGLTEAMSDTGSIERSSFGYRSLFCRKGNYLAAFGSNAGTGGFAIGSTGNSSTYFGVFTNYQGNGDNGVFIGASAGYLATGDNNTIIGANAAFTTTAKSYATTTIIGANVANSYTNSSWGSEDLSNRIIIGNSNALLQPIDANTSTKRVKLNEFINLTPRASAPSSPLKGDIYFDNTINKIKFYNGTAWETMTSS